MDYTYQEFPLRNGELVEISSDIEVTVTSMGRSEKAYVVSKGETSKRVVLSSNVSTDSDLSLPDTAEVLCLLPRNGYSVLYFTVSESEY